MRRVIDKCVVDRVYEIAESEENAEEILEDLYRQYGMGTCVAPLPKKITITPLVRNNLEGKHLDKEIKKLTRDFVTEQTEFYLLDPEGKRFSISEQLFKVIMCSILYANVSPKPVSECILKVTHELILDRIGISLDDIIDDTDIDKTKGTVKSKRKKDTFQYPKLLEYCRTAIEGLWKEVDSNA